MNDIRSHIAERNARLDRVSAELKAELLGIDEVIDRVIESIKAWYVLPQIVQRPVIVCLWGLTGTGKTQLCRLLAQKLGFYDRFVEVQMDGFSNGSGYWRSSISSMLAASGIKEGAPGILLLDEFQRFRTIDDKGADLRVERYQDVWALLSDGRLAPALSFMNDLEESLATALWEDDKNENAESYQSAPQEEAGQRKRRFKLEPYEAQELKRSLKLSESLLEIMAWSVQEVQQRLQAFRDQPERWGTDYSRLLIFVTGNLDKMYENVASRVADCDTDADIFHRYTRKLSVIDAKKALARRFKPEQVARLGNNHVIYPSLDSATYRRLIDHLWRRWAHEIEQTSRLRIEVDASVQAEIYDNAVFPVQGTRPLFSSMHTLLSPVLVNATLWALEEGAQPHEVVHLSLGEDRKHLRACWRGCHAAFAVNFELNRLKQRSNEDFRALLAVHEAGHALLYGLLLRQVPLEVKINVASFDGGYASFLPLKARSRRDLLDMICVTLGGRAAEAQVFGPSACTTGAQEDLRQATEDAAEFVRHHGFSGRLSRTDVGCEVDCVTNTDVASTNALVEDILSAQYGRAQTLLQQHGALLARIAQALVAQGEVSRADLGGWLGLPVRDEPAVLEPYAQHLSAFTQRQLQPVGAPASRSAPQMQAQAA